MNITQVELDSLEASQSETEWNHVCDGIKKARNGNYPPDWWPRVKLSGLMDKVMAKWGDSSDLKVVPIDKDDPIFGN